MTPRTRLSIAEARRVAVRAAGLDGALPGRRGVSGAAALAKVVDRLGVLQIDSVNVFERSHHLVEFARLGPYERPRLDRLLHHDTALTLGGFTEYLAHEAAVIRVSDWPLWAWKRDARHAREADLRAELGPLVDEIRDEFARRGPLRPTELEHPSNVRVGGGWWNKSAAHRVTSSMFRTGELVTLGRERFERRLALADDVLPAEARTGLPRREAMQELIRRAARAQGVGTLADLGDHHRLPTPDARQAVADLVATGELEEVEVPGWPTAYASPDLVVPRRVRSAALLSPFDPLVWFRPRAERLFGFEYRISIYTPAARREHGYYVLPVLVDDELVGRIDLKSDRQAGVLRVQHAHVEPGSAGRMGELAERVAPLLREAADWQGLQQVAVTGPGTWAPTLAAELDRSGFTPGS